MSEIGRIIATFWQVLLAVRAYFSSWFSNSVGVNICAVLNGLCSNKSLSPVIK
jgi:hypothetical protein